MSTTIIKQLHNKQFRFIKLNKDKSPVCGIGWKESKNQFTFDQYKKGNIGIIAGYNNLKIIDLDVKRKNSKGQYETIPQLITQAEKFINKYNETFGKTLIIKTISGGYHIFLMSEYKCPEKAYFNFSKNVDGEFRSHNSYVATIPSTINNKQYTIHTNEKIHNVNMNDLAMFLLNYSNNDTIYGSRTDLSNSGNEMSILCTLIKKRISKEKILQIMSNMPKWASSSEAYKNLTLKNALKFLNIKSLQEDEEIEFKPYNIQSILEQGVPKIEYTLDPFLLKNGITMFIAPPSSMKSFLAQQLSLSCCTGTAFLDKFETTKQNVLYLDEENGIIGIATRISQLLNGHEIDMKAIGNRLVCLSYEAMRFDNEMKMDELKRHIIENKTNVIIIDSIVRFVDGDENKASDIKFVFDKLKGLCKQFSLSILILHHTPKANPESARGSSDFIAAPDNVFSIKKTSDCLIIKSQKERYKKNQDDGHIIKIISDEDKVRLTWEGPFNDYKTKIEKAVDKIREFIKEHHINTFKTSEVKRFLEEFNVEKQTHKALKQLENEQVITCRSAGNKSLWEITEDIK